MSESGVITLGDLITRVRQEADMVNSQFVTDPEIVTYLSSSYKELYDLLVTAYGEDYEVAQALTITTNGTDFLYPLPDGSLYSGAAAFYKLLGVDLQLSPNNPAGYVTIKTFPFSERNRFAVPNFASFWGFTNVRYRLQGNNLWLTPLPAIGAVFRIWYIPRPTDLIFSVQGVTTDQSTTMTVNDTSNLSVGMNVFGEDLADNTTITVVGVGNVTLSKAALGTGTGTIQAFSYLTPVDGISGWEEYPVVDTAIKCKDKEESNVEVLAARKAGLRKRVEDTSANRDPGSAAKTADVMTDMFWNNGNGTGDGYGSGN